MVGAGALRTGSPPPDFIDFRIFRQKNANALFITTRKISSFYADLIIRCVQFDDVILGP